MSEGATTQVESQDGQTQPAGVDVHEAEPPQAAEGVVESPGGQIDILLDATMQVAARLGQAELKVRDLLQMGPGSVLPLDKQVGQPVELYLRGIKFATGMLVVVGDRLGVRIKEILPPEAVGKSESA